MPAATTISSLQGALAHLETRWGRAAVRIGAAPTSGSLALASLPAPEQPPAPAVDGVLSTGFARLDELLGVGGLPRGASLTLRGEQSSGKTAVALHCLAHAQAEGAIVAFVDMAGVLDPLEAASRGVDLHWLLVVRPLSAEDGFEIAAALLAGRQIDLLVLDLPARLAARHAAGLHRLAAHARRQGIRLIVLEPVALGRQLHGALAEAMALRLELEQRDWLRVGRDVVGRCVSVSVAKNRFGPPGRATELEIRYVADGELQSAADRWAGPAT
jgi:recombination protein RecA